jgi:ProP effector
MTPEIRLETPSIPQSAVSESQAGDPAPHRPPAGAATPQPDARGVLAMLHQTSPTFRETRPLALRIDKAIAARFPDLDRKAIRHAMRLYTASTRYLKVMEKATTRFDLDGKEDGEVTEEQRAHAKQTLKERFAESAKRRKAALEQEKAQREAEEAERRKAEKLQQLLGKFSRN